MLKIQIEGTVDKLSGPGSKTINRQLMRVLPIVVTEIAEDIERKNKELASGADQAINKLPNQANHPIGKSESGYVSTGELERGISLFFKGTSGNTSKAEIISESEKSEWVEFGTGEFGPTGHKIVPARGEALKFTTPNFGTMVVQSVKGQRPNPFLRSGIWFVVENIKITVDRIQKIIDRM